MANNPLQVGDRVAVSGYPGEGVKTEAPLIVSYGAGVNSTAMLCGFAERGLRPDAILFADTGAEKPATYDYLYLMSEWVRTVGFPPIERLRYAPTRAGAVAWASLEQECLERSQLPSLAYGFHKCSEKWKVRPQQQWLAKWARGQEFISAGGKVRKAIGFRLGEERRRKDHIQDPGTVKVYPLLDWGWDQDDCIAAILRAGLPVPPKSSCFFCPASSKREVAKLALDDPALFARAVAIEDGAIAGGQLQTVRGLGRNWTWRGVGELAAAQCVLPMDFGGTDLPCGCTDGDDD